MKYLIVALVLLVGCSSEPPPPIHGKIVDVYREFKLGMPDGTTIVEWPDGTRHKYNGRLGKKGEVINVQGMPQIAF